MRLVLPLMPIVLGALAAPLGFAVAAAPAAPGEPGKAETASFEMVTDDKASNRAFYEALGFEWVPDENLRDADAVHGAGYCIRLARRYHLDEKQARFLGLLYVAQHAIAPACYTLQPFTDDLAAKRCELMHRPVQRNDPATHTLVCGPLRPTTKAEPQYPNVESASAG